MKPETLIYDKIKKIIPEKSEKTVFFAGITNTSKEVYFYTFIDGKYEQCFSLAEKYEFDENELSEVFSNVVKIIKDSTLYLNDKYNIATIIVDNEEVSIKMEYFDVDISEYKIQKEWKKKYLCIN
jgi:hypothetical protein